MEEFTDILRRADQKYEKHLGPNYDLISVLYIELSTFGILVR